MVFVMLAITSAMSSEKGGLREFFMASENSLQRVS
jgi:hypothetical protein